MTLVLLLEKHDKNRVREGDRKAEQGPERATRGRMRQRQRDRHRDRERERDRQRRRQRESERARERESERARDRDRARQLYVDIDTSPPMFLMGWVHSGWVKISSHGLSK